MSRGRRACTSAATSPQVAEGSGSGGEGPAGGVGVPHPAPPVHRHVVGPAGGRLSLEEGEAAAWAEVPAVGGVPPHHPAVPGRPPQRLAGLLLPQWCQVPASCVGQSSAPGVRPGGAREEDPGVPPLQGLADGGPLGPELGAIGALDGGQPDRAVHAWWRVCHHPLQAPARRSRRRGTPGHSASRRARAQVVLAQPRRWWEAGKTWAAWPYHHRGRARPWCRRRLQRGGGGGGASRCARALALGAVLAVPVQWAKEGGGRSQGGQDRSHGGQGSGQGGGGGRWQGVASCRTRFHPSQSPVSRRTLLARLAATVRPGGGGGGADTPLAAPSARDSRSAAAAGWDAVTPPPRTGVGPPATARTGSPHREGPRAITSPRGALVGCGRIDNLLQHRGSGSRAHRRGKPNGARSAAATTITNPGRSR